MAWDTNLHWLLQCFLFGVCLDRHWQMIKRPCVLHVCSSAPPPYEGTPLIVSYSSKKEAAKYYNSDWPPLQCLNVNHSTGPPLHTPLFQPPTPKKHKKGSVAYAAALVKPTSKANHWKKKELIKNVCGYVKVRLCSIFIPATSLTVIALLNYLISHG